MIGLGETREETAQRVIGAVLDLVDQLQGVKFRTAAFERLGCCDHITDDLFDVPFRIPSAGFHDIAGFLGFTGRGNSLEIQHGLGGLHAQEIVPEAVLTALGKEDIKHGTV